MASLCRFFALFLSLFIAGICDATDYNILDFKMARRHEQWMAEYGRVYKDEAEKTKRFEIFKRNVEYIEQFNNAGGHNYTLGINLFTDLTPEEFKATYTGTGRFQQIPESETFEDDSLEQTTKSKDTETNDCPPKSVDWRKEGAVSPVKFQGENCSACWAFTAVATIESLKKIKGGPLHELSAQQLIDCSTTSRGCSGGFVHRAYSYIRKCRGLTTSANYPYTGSEGNCHELKRKEIVAKISGYKRVHPTERCLMKAVAKQPVAAGIQVSDDIQHYESGVFHGSCGNSTDQIAVAVVGYGEDNGEKCWIAKNSWGDKWGEGGYIRMEREGKSPQGICGIAKNAYYPKM